MIVLPFDHLIKYNKMFTNILSDGCDLAEKGPNLVTIGITPDYPETYQGLRKIQKVIGTRQQEKKLIATVGIENLIVVDTEDAVEGANRALISVITPPIMPYRHLPQTLRGMAADCSDWKMPCENRDIYSLILSISVKLMPKACKIAFKSR